MIFFIDYSSLKLTMFSIVIFKIMIGMLRVGMLWFENYLSTDVH